VCNETVFAIIHFSLQLAPEVTTGGMLQGKYLKSLPAVDTM